MEPQRCKLHSWSFPVNSAADWIYGEVVHPVGSSFVEGFPYAYKNAGKYIAEVDGCCTLSTLLNNQHDQNFNIESEVNVGAGSEPASPVMNVDQYHQRT